MLSGNMQQRQRPKKSGLISNKTTLHVQHTYFVLQFAIVLHDYNVKIPETSYNPGQNVWDTLCFR